MQATSLLPFFPYTAFGKGLLGDNAADSQNIPGALRGNDQRDFFYKPVDAWAADFIPLYDNGEFQLFYLLDWRDKEKHGEGTPWYRITTKDFVNFTEHGEVLPRGANKSRIYMFLPVLLSRLTGNTTFFIRGIILISGNRESLNKELCMQ